ncbi:ribosomal protein S5 domain 2-type protein [Exophiala viscosa]|uniref:Ribosomal protein S5 domain 2-type protein n=1 Tax=Exophiala viscosa TaxID=2486360 RepID=A0AAN6E026_9EURO|nr:ribosomal protein S5 domain 2-type protein [Exophiala viscosa]KAI1624364.1 ribosomal protein S5 domain 2-type protein [Exophiala viscosa]
MSQDGRVTQNEALADELEALNSIYGPNTIVLQSESATEATAVLCLPELPFSFLASFPSEYPFDAPPTIVGTQSTGGSGRGEGEIAVSILRDVVGRVWVPGQVCLFDLVEEGGPLLQQQHEHHDHGASEDHSTNVANRSASPSFPETSAHDLISDAASSNIVPPAWVLSEPLTANKSTFVARAAPVSTLPEAMDAISHLLSTNKKVAGATHNITAWRIQAKNAQTGTSTTIQDCDDDGETAAGGRLLHLMQLMDVWNVIVVVTRWYGGVKLGPDRFRLINTVAREALVKGGFAKEEGEKSKSKGKGKK